MTNFPHRPTGIHNEVHHPVPRPFVPEQRPVSFADGYRFMRENDMMIIMVPFAIAFGVWVIFQLIDILRTAVG